MIPSFAWQALRGITRDGRKKRAEKEEIVKRYPHDSFKLAKAKRKVDKRGVNFSAEGKEAILGYVEKGVPIDIREMLMMRGEETALEIEERWYGRLVDIKSLSLSEREQLFDHRLHLYKRKAEEYARSQRGLDLVFSAFLEKQEYQNRAAVEAGYSPASDTRKQLARSWDEKFESAQPDKDS